MIGNALKEIWSVFEELINQVEVWVILFLLGFTGAVLLAVPAVHISGILDNIIIFLRSTWWLWFFVVFLPMFNSILLQWRQEEYKCKLKFIILELHMPREITKSPKAMEQVLQSLHSLRNSPGDIKEKYKDGEVTVPFGLEMVSFGGQVHFYVRCQKKQRNLVEAAFFSYYPDVEIEEVEDYVAKFPKTMQEVYTNNWDIWGTEMVLAKEEALPIKTYPAFEHEAEEKQFDPISSFLEVLGKLKGEEIVGIQILIAPADAKWGKKWDHYLKDLQSPATTEIASGDEEGSTRQVTIARSPGQIDVLEAVEEHLSKQAFHTLIRFTYLSPKATYYDSFARRGLVGAFNQYSALNLNSFRQNYTISTRTRIWNWPHIFPKLRNEYRKQRLLRNYLVREIPPETWWGKFINSYLFNFYFKSKRVKMTTEEIATLFHPPTAVVLTAPHVRRVESKKAGPPAGLAIFGGEDQIKQYQ